VSQYGVWDSRREKYRPLHAESAMDLEAAHHGISWSARIYSASI
jgi:hypothetical protein